MKTKILSSKMQTLQHCTSLSVGFYTVPDLTTAPKPEV